MRKLLFPAMMMVFLVLMLVSDFYPQFFVPGAALLFLIFTILLAILSFLGFVYT